MTEVGERDIKAAGAHPLIIAAAFATGANTNEIYRAVTDVVVAVSLKILGGKLPVTGDIPLLDAAQHFRAALTAIPAVQDFVEIDHHAPQVVQKRWRRRVPGGPDGALVVGELGDG